MTVEDAFIEGIVKIANHEEVVKLIEPNVRYHEPIDSGQVQRVLYARHLLEKEAKKKCR